MGTINLISLWEDSSGFYLLVPVSFEAAVFLPRGEGTTLSLLLGGFPSFNAEQHAPISMDQNVFEFNLIIYVLFDLIIKPFYFRFYEIDRQLNSYCIWM